jgi:hypothetical protein
LPRLYKKRLEIDFREQNSNASGNSENGTWMDSTLLDAACFPSFFSFLFLLILSLSALFSLPLPLSLSSLACFLLSFAIPFYYSLISSYQKERREE